MKCRQTKNRPTGLRWRLAMLMAGLIFIFFQPIQAVSSQKTADNIGSLLKQAANAIRTGHIVKPEHTALVHYIDQVFADDPGNPQAYRLLYTALDELYANLQASLGTINSLNRMRRLQEADSYRQQAYYLINRFQLDPKAGYRMDRLLAVVQPQNNRSQSVARKENHGGRSPWGQTNRPGNFVPRDKIAWSWDHLRVIGVF